MRDISRDLDRRYITKVIGNVTILGGIQDFKKELEVIEQKGVAEGYINIGVSCDIVDDEEGRFRGGILIIDGDILETDNEWRERIISEKKSLERRLNVIEDLKNNKDSCINKLDKIEKLLGGGGVWNTDEK